MFTPQKRPEVNHAGTIIRGVFYSRKKRSHRIYSNAQIRNRDESEIGTTQDRNRGVLLGKDEVIAKTLACLLAEGHLLVEDLPGQGKTTLAKAISKLCGLADSRIQATMIFYPRIYLSFNSSKQTQTFRCKGPIFAEILVR